MVQLGHQGKSSAPEPERPGIAAPAAAETKVAHTKVSCQEAFRLNAPELPNTG